VQNLSKAEMAIIQKESSFQPTAKNPETTAFGLGQLLVSNRIKHAEKIGVEPDTTDEAEQIGLFRSYVAERYGTAEKALNFRSKKGWY